MSVTKWILMDWLGTATNVRETVVPELERFGKRCRINANWDEVMEAWGLAHRAILDQVVAGQLTWRPQSQVFLEAFRDVLTKVGIDFEAIPNIALASDDVDTTSDWFFVPLTFDESVRYDEIAVVVTFLSVVVDRRTTS